MQIFYFSFDEVPSFKGASTHILAGLRSAILKHKVVLFTLGDNKLPSLNGFEHEPLTIREENYLKRALVFRQRVEKILKERRTDLVHFRGIWEGLPCVRSGIPSVYEVNALPSIELQENYSQLSPQFLGRVRREEAECLNKASSIIVPSQLIANCLLQEHQIAQHKIQVIPNGHDLHLNNKTFSSDPLAPLRMVYLGTLHPWQGLLWSIPHLKALEGKLELDVYGPDQKLWSHYFHKRIRKHSLQKMIKHRGPLMRPEFHTILPSYDLGFAPFLQTVRNVRQGAHPVKLLDYFSHGVPVLTSDLPMARQLVDEGINGVFFKPQGHKELTELLHGLIANRSYLNELAEGAANKARSLPSWDIYSQVLLEVYKRSVTKEAIALR